MNNVSSPTVIVGATPNVARYAFIAAEMLLENGIDIVPIGIKKGEILGHPIMDIREKPALKDVHTISMYIGASKQEEYYDYLLSLAPKRIIFNPGTENGEFMELANGKDIEGMNACTLVMLRLGMY